MRPSPSLSRCPRQTWSRGGCDHLGRHRHHAPRPRCTGLARPRLVGFRAQPSSNGPVSPHPARWGLFSFCGRLVCLNAAHSARWLGAGSWKAALGAIVGGLDVEVGRRRRVGPEPGEPFAVHQDGNRLRHRHPGRGQGAQVGPADRRGAVRDGVWCAQHRQWRRRGHRARPDPSSVHRCLSPRPRPGAAVHRRSRGHRSWYASGAHPRRGPGSRLSGSSW